MPGVRPARLGTTRTERNDLMDLHEFCVFCEIAAGRAPATVVKEWPRALAIVPLEPVTDGHVLVLPKDHSADFTTGSAALLWATMGAAQLAREMGGDMNLITSKGRAATQSVFHLHLHLVPRRRGDSLTLPWTTAEAVA
jgi:histidine triad (HIT) family protein